MRCIDTFAMLKELGSRFWFVRKLRGWTPARAACEVGGRERVRECGRCGTLGFSHGDFSFIVEALDDAAGKQLLSPEIVQNQFTMLTQRLLSVPDGPLPAVVR